MRSIVASIALLQGVVSQTAKCDPCDCDKNGIVWNGQIMEHTDRPGCAAHLANTDPFCYVLAECQYPLASESGAFPGLKYYTCDPTHPSMAAATTDECDREIACAKDGEWPKTLPGMTATLQCATGFTGTKTRVCNDKGVWQTAVDTCVIAATCDDNKQNGDETGIDCGGKCKACDLCGMVNCGSKGNCVPATGKCTCIDGYTGQFCSTPPADPCDSVNCGTFGSCKDGKCTCIFGYTGILCDTPPVPTCSDGIQNGMETGVDCGGNASATEMCPQCSSVRWRIGVWGDCKGLDGTTVTCGEGKIQRDVDCIRDYNATYQEVLEDSRCAHLHPAIKEQKCTLNACPVYEWKVLSQYGSCSRECGTGQRYRQVVCISDLGDVTVPDSNCDAGTKPANQEDCNTQSCSQSTWVQGPWSGCSATCGGGTQQSTVTCDKVAAADCDPAKKPPEERACNVIPCGSYSWQLCEWDDCTAECNGGTGMLGLIYRNVLCQDARGIVVDNSLCDISRMPTSQVEGCNTQACTDYNWMANGPWSVCDRVTKTQERTFHCHGPDGSNELNKACQDNSIPLPLASRPCVPNTCPGGTEPGGGGVSAASNAKAWPLLTMTLFAVGLTRASFHSKFVVLSMVCLSVLISSVDAKPLERQHLQHVTKVTFIEMGENPGTSTNGHPTPHAHELRLLFKTPFRTFELDLNIMHHLLAADLADRRELVSYSAKGEGISGSITIVDWAAKKFGGLLRTSDDLFTLTPEDQEQFDVQSPEGMLVYRESALSDTPHDHRRLLEKFGYFGEADGQKVSTATRKLMTLQPFKADCHEVGKAFTFKIWAAADFGYVNKAPQTSTNIQQMVAQADQIYYDQFRFHLQIVGETFRTKAQEDTPAWNVGPTINADGQRTSQCSINSASTLLNTFKNWAGEGTQRQKTGLYHLFTDCFPPPGTVGIAWLDVLCTGQGYNTGLTSYLGSRTWLTFAHEVGHNFDGEHSFEDGQGSTGGIMDYGDGLLDGTYQFNRKYRETKMCSAMKSAVNYGKQGNQWCIEEFNQNAPTTPPTNKAPTAAPAPTAPPSNPPTTACGTKDAHNACPVWKSLGSCTAATSSKWMRENCGPTCCVSGFTVTLDDSCGPHCAVCADATSCQVCSSAHMPFNGRCYNGLTTDAVGIKDYLALSVVVGENLAGGNGVMLTGTLKGETLVLSLKDYHARVQYGADYDLLFEEVTVTKGMTFKFNMISNYFSLEVGGQKMPKLPYDDESGTDSFRGQALTSIVAGDVDSTYTITGVHV